MRDPELVARAQRAATRLESAWEQWRALHGLADAPGQPVVSYVGYSLKEPWGEPRVVIGIDADEAEYLAEFLDRDECAQRGQAQVQQSRAPQAPVQQAQLQQAQFQSAQLQPPSHQQGQLQPPSHQQGQLKAVPLQAGPLQSGPLQQVKRTEPLPEGTGEYPSPALLNGPSAVGRGRPSPDQARDIAAELVGWNQGELPSQLPEQFASWPPGMPTTADQPPASA
jgi:hypothetical protein